MRKKRTEAEKKKVTSAVKGGMTYSEVAKKFGLTTNIVAGICHRAGVKVGYRPENCHGPKALRIRWANATEADRQRQVELMQRGRILARQRRQAAG